MTLVPIASEKLQEVRREIFTNSFTTCQPHVPRFGFVTMTRGELTRLLSKSTHFTAV